MKTLLILFSIVSFSRLANAEDPDPIKVCSDAIAKAKTDLTNYSNQLANQAALAAANHATPNPTQGGTIQVASTGNPLSDAAVVLNSTNQQLASLQQQKMDMQSQADNECFNQRSTIEDNLHEFRQSSYKRQQEIKIAETEKLKQISDITINCQAEAGKLYMEDVANKAVYSNRIVSTVGGVTSSSNQLAGRRDYYFNQCMASGATQETLNMANVQLNAKMANLATESQSVASDIAYQESKEANLSEMCKLKQQQIDAKMAVPMNAAKQQQAMNLIGILTSASIGSANASSQAQATNNFQSINDILTPTKWSAIESACNNLVSSNTNSPFAGIPADAFPTLAPINAACRPKGSSANCVTSSSTNSLEMQRLPSNNGATGVGY